MATRPDPGALLAAAFDYWSTAADTPGVTGETMPGTAPARIIRIGDGWRIEWRSQTAELEPVSGSAAGWTLRIGDQPPFRVASLGAALRELRVAMDQTFIPGRALIGAAPNGQ